MSQKSTQEKISQKRQFLKNTIYSQTAAIATLFLTNVFDVVKIRQIEDINNCSTEHFKNKTLTNSLFQKFYSINSPINQTFAGCLDCLPQRNFILTIFHLTKQNGFAKTFLTGIDKNIYMQIVRAGMFFPFFEYFKQKSEWLDKNTPENNSKMRSTLVSSFLARAITSIFSFPFEVVKIREQAGSENIKILSHLDLAKKFINKKGKYSKIFLVYFQRELYFSLIFWTMMEKLTHKFGEEQNAKKDLWVTGKSAFFCGALSSLITYPFDLIATNQILSSTNFNSSSSLATIKFFVGNYGWRYFLNGLSLRIIRSSINSMLFVGTFQYFKNKENFE